MVAAAALGSTRGCIGRHPSVSLSSPLIPPSLPAVVAVVLAFFALRPGKGWLRRKGTTTPVLEDGKLAPKLSGSPKVDTFVSGSRTGGGPDADTFISGPSGGGPAMPAGTLVALPASLTAASLGPDTLLQYSSGGLREPAPTAPEAPPLSTISHANAGLIQQPSVHAPPPSYISSAGLGAAGGVTVAPPASGDATGLQTASRSSG